MKIEQKNGNVVPRRTPEETPPRLWMDDLIGRPLATADAQHQTIRKIDGLAVFASDVLSSTAYAARKMMAILAAAGTLAFGYVFPLSMVVTRLYAQIIRAGRLAAAAV